MSGSASAARDNPSRISTRAVPVDGGLAPELAEQGLAAEPVDHVLGVDRR